MYIETTNKTLGEFPSQRKLTKQKGNKFFISCIDAAVDSLHLRFGDSIRQSFSNMDENYKLANGELIEDWQKRMSNPWGFKTDTFPAKTQHYPIANVKFDLLVGEEWKRRFDWICMVINPEAVSEKADKIKNAINRFLMEKVMSENFDIAAVEEEIAGMDKWTPWSVKDIREKRATEYLNYLWRKHDMKHMFNQGMQDVLNIGEEVYAVSINKGEPRVRKVDPKGIMIFRSGKSHRIEDADIIVEVTYMAPGQAADLYRLDSREIKALENTDHSSTDDPLRPVGMQPAMPTTDMHLQIDISDLDSNDYYQGPFDSDGNVRVARTCWKTFRKIGRKTYYDMEGEKQYDIVDENYVPRKELNEDVQWEWIPEWCEGTKIGDKIYKDMKFINGNYNPYVGSIYSINKYKVKSLRDRTKPYEYLYDVIMYRTEKAFAKAVGRIGILNAAMIPDKWEPEKWMYYAEEMGWAIYDPFTEGKKGAALGKMAGTFSGMPSEINRELGNYIQQHIMMLQFIEAKIGDITGVSKQREGQIENRETVGGIERAVTQSSHITEKWFALHDNTKIRVLKELLQAAKYAWRDRKESIQFITDDISQVISEIDGEMMREVDLGVDITNAADDLETFNIIKQQIPTMLQHDKRILSTLMMINSSRSLASIRHKVEEIEDENIEREQEAMRIKSETDQAIAQQNAQEKAEELRVQEESNIRDNQTELLVKEMDIRAKQSEGTGDDSDLDIQLKKILQTQDKIDKDYNLKLKKLEEDKRSNRANETIQKKKLSAVGNK